MQNNNTNTPSIESMAAIAEALNRNNEIIMGLANVVSPMLYYMASTGTYNLSMPNLDNCTEDAQSTPEEVTSMASKRTRVCIGHDERGNAKHMQISGRTQDERNDNIVRAYVESGRIWEFVPMPQAFQAVPAASIVKHDLKTFGEDYINRYKVGKCSNNYVYNYRKRFLDICKFFDGWMIEDIKTDDVQNYLNARGHLAKSTLSDRMSTLKDVYSFALKEDIVKKNPVDLKWLKNPGHDTEGTKPLAEDQYIDVLNHIPDLNEPREQLTVAMFLCLGLRPEEVRGLMWEDIDWNGHGVRIQRAVTYAGGKVDIRPPKTKASKAWIPVNDELWKYFEMYRQDNGYIVHDSEGQCFTQNRWGKFWKGITEQINLYEMQPREGRTTFGTLHIINGTDYVTTSKYMRHASPTTTIQKYAKPGKDVLIKHCNALPKAAL